MMMNNLHQNLLISVVGKEAFYLYNILTWTTIIISIFTFMKGFEHRERKGYWYSNRQQALDHITNGLCGRSLPKEPYRLCNSSTSRRQKKKRGSYIVIMLDFEIHLIGESFLHMMMQAFQALCVDLLLHLQR